MEARSENELQDVRLPPKRSKEFEDARQWLYIIGFIDMIGVSLVIPVLAIFARQLGMSHIEIGILISIYGALQMFSSPLVGSVSDQAGSKTVLVISLTFTAISYSILGLSGLTGDLRYFIVGRIIAGFFKHTQTLVEAYFSVCLPTKEALIAVSEYSAISRLGLIVGPIIGGMVADRKNGFTFVCSVAASIFLVNAGIVYFAIPPAKAVRNTDDSSSGLFSSLRTVDFAAIWDALLFRFMVAFAAMMFRDNLSLVLKEKYHLGVKTTGYIISYEAAIGAATSFAVGPLIAYYSLSTLNYITTITLCFTLLFVITSLNMWILLTTLVPFNFTNSILRVTTLEQLTRTSNPEEIGAILGLAQSCLSLARMLSPLCSGALLEKSTDGPAVGGAVIAAFAVLLWFLIVYRKSSSEESDLSYGQKDGSFVSSVSR